MTERTTQEFRTWQLGSLLLTQGLWAKWRTPRLPPAEGPTEGSFGNGPRLCLLAIGDSIIAGVGVESTWQAMPARLAERIRYLGYLAPPLDPPAEGTAGPGFREPDRPHVLCMAGGGVDGADLVSVFLEAAVRSGTWNATVVTGPFLPRAIVQELHERHGHRPRSWRPRSCATRSR